MFSPVHPHLAPRSAHIISYRLYPKFKKVITVTTGCGTLPRSCSDAAQLQRSRASPQAKCRGYTQAAATLLTAGTDGQPTPWLELTWRYWDYDDPAIAVVTPTDFVDVGALSQQAPAAAEMPLAADTSLRIRVFAHPGRPAAEAVVTVYPANKRQALAAWQTADAQFALPAGAYDVQVWAEGAEMWLHGVLVVAETATSHDVLFDFGALSLTVTQGESRPQVDIVIYPAGQRQTWLAWRTENPTTVRLPAGLYDVEIALPDHSATRRVEGIQVQGSETVEVTVALGE